MYDFYSINLKTKIYYQKKLSKKIMLSVSMHILTFVTKNNKRKKVGIFFPDVGCIILRLH